MIYLGIDNGIGGALTAYDAEANEVTSIPMPVIKVQKAKGNKNEYDIPTIVAWFRKYMSYDIMMKSNVKMVILEKAQPFPGQGAVSMFSIGRGYGIMEGILAGLGLPYMVIHPKTWQKKMFEGMPHQDTKQASIVTASRLFPGARFFGSDKSTKLHNGMTDAALMAYYGYLLHK